MDIRFFVSFYPLFIIILLCQVQLISLLMFLLFVLFCSFSFMFSTTGQKDVTGLAVSLETSFALPPCKRAKITDSKLYDSYTGARSHNCVRCCSRSDSALLITLMIILKLISLIILFIIYLFIYLLFIYFSQNFYLFFYYYSSLTV
jgi:hypothetical protein